MSYLFVHRIVLIGSTLLSVGWSENVAGQKWLAVRPTSTEYIRTLPFPNSLFKYKYRGKDTNGLFTLFEAEYFDDGPGKHIHTREDELFHIIQGNVQFFVDGKQFCGSTGDYVYVPRNISQAVRISNTNKDGKPVKIQILLTPAGLEGFLDEIEPLYYNGQNDLTSQENIAKKYGIVNLEPVKWLDLGCFQTRVTSSASRLTPFPAAILSFVKTLF